MEELVKEAVRFVIASELRTERFFCDAAASSTRGYGKIVLERLAAEQRRVVEELGRRYPIGIVSSDRGDGPISSDRGDGPVLHPGESLRERRLLEILQFALDDKHHNLVQYRTFLEAFREPVICDIFGLAFDLSQILQERVAEEYTQAKMNLHRLAPNRRAKRTHIRSGFPTIPPPNRHSQLFISLLDCGRRPLQGRDF